MSIVSHLFNATAVKVVTKKNEMGEQVFASNGEEQPCRFRVTPGENVLQNSNRETVVSDAQLWFNPDVITAEKDIWYVFGENWRVSAVQEARGAGSEVEFLKVFVNRYTQGEA